MIQSFHRLFYPVAAGLVAAALQPAPPPLVGQPAATVQTFRTALVAGDPDRSWTVVWDRGGRLHSVYVMAGKMSGPVPRSTVGFNEAWYDGEYHGRFDLPDGAAPGVCLLDTGAGVLNLTVSSVPKRKVLATPIPAGMSMNVVRNAFAANSVVTLAPGEHVWDGPAVAMPADAILRGYGAVVHRTGTGGDYNARAIVPLGPNVSVYGVAFVYDVPGQVFHCYPQSPSGLVVADCTFRRCNFGYGPVDVLVRDCRFENAGAVIAPPGLWFQNTFTGPPREHAFQYWGYAYPGGHRLALVDNTFDGTDRGPCFRTMDGNCSDFLFFGTKLRNIHSTRGGDEYFACEGTNGEFDRNLFLHTDAYACDGAFQPSGNGDTYARDGLVRDLQIDGGSGILFWGRVSGWTVQDFELRRAGVYCGPGPGAKPGDPVPANNTFADGGVFDWHPTRSSAGFQNQSPVLLGRKSACVDDTGGKNTFTRIQMPEAVVDQKKP